MPDGNLPTIVVAVLLGIVEGLTEFIPVSSTGHLILAGSALNIRGAAADTFDVFIQLGAILAVLVLYWRRIAALLQFGKTQGVAFSGLDGCLKLFACALPVFIAGPLFHDYIKGELFKPLPVAAALIAGGIAIVLLDREQNRPVLARLEQVSLKQCVIIGLFQCLSLWPGISRSGSTIIGGMIAGLNRSVAAEFSFLVAVPVMFAAVAYDLKKNFHHLSGADIEMFAAGFAVSFIVAVIAIKFFVGIISRFSMKPFGYYRIALGAVVLWLMS